MIIQITDIHDVTVLEAKSHPPIARNRAIALQPSLEPVQLGNTDNAVMTQVRVALCVYPVLAYFEFQARVEQSPQQITRLIHVNLFARRNLIDLFCPPPKINQMPNQLGLWRWRKITGTARTVPIYIMTDTPFSIKADQERLKKNEQGIIWAQCIPECIYPIFYSNLPCLVCFFFLDFADSSYFLRTSFQKFSSAFSWLVRNQFIWFSRYSSLMLSFRRSFGTRSIRGSIPSKPLKVCERRSSDIST